MKLLLTVTVLFEVVTGLALVVAPSLTVSLLLGAPLTEHTGVLLGRIGGFALISLSSACWLSRNDALPSIIMIKALTLYNIAATLLLLYAGLVEKFFGFGLWPAALLHTVLLLWCLQSLRKSKGISA